MMIELDESKLKIIKKADELTFSQTDICCVNFDHQKYMNVNYLFSIIEDLIGEIEDQKNKYEQLEQKYFDQ